MYIILTVCCIDCLILPMDCSLLAYAHDRGQAHSIWARRAVGRMCLRPGAGGPGSQAGTCRPPGLGHGLVGVSWVVHGMGSGHVRRRGHEQATQSIHVYIYIRVSY